MKQIIRMILMQGLLLLAGSYACLGQQGTGAWVYVSLDGVESGDSVSMVFPAAEHGGKGELRLNAMVGRDGRSAFAVEASRLPGYFYLAKAGGKASGGLEPVTAQLWMERGDSLGIWIKPKAVRSVSLADRYSYDARGKGALKYQVRFMADSVLYHASGEGSGVLFDSLQRYNLANTFAVATARALDFLEGYSSRLEQEDYLLLKADIAFARPKMFDLAVHSFRRLGGTGRLRFADSYRETIGRLDLHGVSPRVLAGSKNAGRYLYAQALATRTIVGSRPDSAGGLFGYLKGNFDGALRRALLLRYFLSLSGAEEDLPGQFAQARALDTDTAYRLALARISGRLSGKVFAAGFDLQDSSGRVPDLSRFVNKVVVVDFWFTGCLFCSRYFKSQLSRAEEELRGEEGVVFLSVSIDQQRKGWLSSVASGMYTAETAVNLYTGGKGDASAFVKRFGVKGYPTLLVIGPDGATLHNGVVSESSRYYRAEELVGLIRSILRDAPKKVD